MCAKRGYRRCPVTDEGDDWAQDDAAWHQQELEARQQIEEAWQAMCAACLAEWKAQSEAMASCEATERN